MPNHYNYRFSGERQHPDARPQHPQNDYNHHKSHHHHRREQIPWWLFPFILDSKEGKEYK